MKRSQEIKAKQAEKHEVMMFLLDSITEDLFGKPLHTKVIFQDYKRWRLEKNFSATLYTLKGFGKILPYKRVVVWDGENETVAHAVPGKRLTSD